MTANEKRYYLLGLEGAAKELQIEVDCCDTTLHKGSRICYKYTMRCGVALIRELIDCTRRGL